VLSERDSFTTVSLSENSVPTVVTASNMTEHKVVLDNNLNASLPATQNSFGNVSLVTYFTPENSNP
jgi:hypothetical protein